MSEVDEYMSDAEILSNLYKIVAEFEKCSVNDLWLGSTMESIQNEKTFEEFKQRLCDVFDINFVYECSQTHFHTISHTIVKIVYCMKMGW